MTEHRDGIDTGAASSQDAGDAGGRGAGDVLEQLVDVEAADDAHVERSVADAQETVTPLVESVEVAAPEELPEGDFESVAEVLGDVFDQPDVIATGSIENATVLEARDEVDHVAAQPSPADAAPPPAQRPPEPLPDPTPPAAVEATGEEPTPTPAVDQPPPAAEGAASDAERVAASGGVATLVGALLLALLVRVNYPLRLLPPPARLAVDWLAVTLVFWVPVIWIIAVVL